MEIDLTGSVFGQPVRAVFTSGTHRLGRSTRSDLVLPDPSVSREHAELVVESEKTMVRDLGTRNGTFVNGQKIAGPHPLSPGDRLRLGNVELRVGPETAGQTTTRREEARVSDDRRVVPTLALPWDKASVASALSSVSTRVFLDALLETSKLLVVPQPADVLFDAVLALVERFVPARRLVLLLYDPGQSASDPTQLPPVRAVRPAVAGNEALLLSRTLLQNVLRERKSLLVADAQADSHYREQESIAALRLHTALAAPLFDNEQVIGVLYADSDDPRLYYGEEQLRAFALLANLVAVKITNARLLDDLREKDRMAQELAAAARIQNRLLPSVLPQVPGYQIVAHQFPCFEAGGDLYDATLLGGGACALSVGDVSGKGMAAALRMSHTLAILRLLQEEVPKLSDLARRLHREVYRSTDPEEFVTLFHAWLEPEAHRLDFINCGHNPPMLFLPDGEVRTLDATGLALGMFPIEMMPDSLFSMGTVALPPGAVLCVYSDGIPEASRGGEFFGEERLSAAVDRRRQSPLEEIVDGILSDLHQFLGETPVSDDITLLLVRREAMG